MARVRQEVTQMFKQKSNNKARIETLIGANTRIGRHRGLETDFGARITGKLIHRGKQGPGRGDSDVT